MALQDRQPELVWVPLLLLTVALLAIAARAYVRLTNKTYGLDDLLIALGGFFFIFQCATVIGGGIHGIGLQAEHITPQDYIAAGQWFYFNVMAYSVAAAFTRLSILFTLLRITVTPGYKYSIFVAMAAIIAIAFQGVIFLLVQCKPISWYWDKTTGTGSCVSSTAISANTITTTFVPAATDVFSAILPIILLWKIQMNIRTKILACGMLGFGAFAAVTIIVRLPAIVDLQDHETSLYSVAPPQLWGTAETGIGIFAASLSALRPLFRSFTGSTRDYDNTAASYSMRTPNGTAGRFRTTARSNGMTKLDTPHDSETWRSAKNSNVPGGSDAIQYEMHDIEAKQFRAKTSVISGPNLAKRSQSDVEDLHGDSNSETEILGDRQWQKGITMEKTYVVETSHS